MIGVVGGANPLPEEEAILYACDRLVICNRYTHRAVARDALESNRGEVFDMSQVIHPNSYSPFIGFKAVCYALRHPMMNPGSKVYCGFMDLYAKALGVDEDHVHKNGHDRATHALMFKALKGAYGDRLIFPDRLSRAIEKLSELTPGKRHRIEAERQQR